MVRVVTVDFLQKLVILHYVTLQSVDSSLHWTFFGIILCLFCTIECIPLISSLWSAQSNFKTLTLCSYLSHTHIVWKRYWILLGDPKLKGLCTLLYEKNERKNLMENTCRDFGSPLWNLPPNEHWFWKNQLLQFILKHLLFVSILTTHLLKC